MYKRQKPVGLVCFCVATGAGDRITRSIRLPGGRADVRDRSTTVSLHLLRRLLRGESDRPLPGPEDARGSGASPAGAPSSDDGDARP